MPANAATRTYKPYVLVDTKDLPEEEWLEYRRQGIGGSDAAAVLGVSPFRTARDLYYDKLKIVTYEDPEDNWVQKKMGHLLEDLVAEIFHVRTGFEIYQVKKMFYHPHHPFMLADVDYFITLPNGETAILEIKTTNYNATDHWWRDGEEAVPVNYEIQGRHYMAVMNVDHVYFCCLYGNSEQETIIRHIERDLDYEAELIMLEDNFWNGHVQRRIPPSYVEDGELIIESVKNHFGSADPNATAIELSLTGALLLTSLLLGLRRGEVVGLMWSDFDFKNACVHINRSAYKVKGVPQSIKMPKSKNSIRTVYFSEEYAYTINLWREEQENQKREAGNLWIEQDFVFTNENGGMINLYALTEICSKFEEKCGLRHLKLHGLRHTCASLMIKSGVDIETVKSMFGHESIRTTQQYLSAYDSAKKSAAQTLTDVIISKKGGDE